jgi:hypothetical protein
MSHPNADDNSPIDTLPGFRRRLIITPSSDRVVSELEDDYHCMGVTVYHDGGIATAVEPVMARAPWTTCPGAIAVLQQTFIGVALDKFAARGEKRANCTHLHDLAVLAAAHAFDREPLVYDIFASDPVDGRRRSELRRNGTAVLSWTMVEGRFVEPAQLAGVALNNMRSWIDSLERERQEAARLLRWGTMISHGRSLSVDWESGARYTATAGSCYTFQAQRMNEARHIGAIRDFSDGAAQPLEHRPVALQPQNSTYALRDRDHASGTFGGRRPS